jgi:tRNA(Ile)-lysidine synthase
MDNIRQRFIKELQSNGISPQGKAILLCVSGGIDSAVMTHLFHDSGYKIGIAHVNYKLRGTEADEDENFTRALAESFRVPFFVYHAGQAIKERARGQSIQMAARNIRYQWFQQLLNNGEFDFGATAHHADDEFETFLMNVSRGTGGKGLSGYTYINGNFIKPLLGFTRAEIALFATEKGIKWREDSSNIKDIYLRNRIRHTIIPAIREVFPDFVEKMHGTFTRLKRERMLLEGLIAKASESLVVHTAEGIEIEAYGLLGLPDPPFILFELIRNYGFSMIDCASICGNLTRADGQQYLTDAWSLRLERDKIFIISNLNEKNIRRPELLLTEVAEMPEIIGEIPKTQAYIDLEKAGRNLHLRKWQKGDYFYPTGMKGKKLISDFFNEQKIPFHRRAEQYLLMRGDDVVWVVNFRIDRRFAADINTRAILLASIR